VLDVLGVDYRSHKGKIHCLYPDHVERTGSMKVYEKTNSAFCFGCNRSADIIEIVRLQGGKNGERASLREAVKWFEKTFQIEVQAQAKGLTERLGGRLSKWRNTRQAPAVSSQHALTRVLNVRDGIINGVPTWVRLEVAPMEDYIWDELDTPGTDPTQWESWAVKLLNGTYRARIEALFTSEQESLRSHRSLSGGLTGL
jgi:hypothetical protein